MNGSTSLASAVLLALFLAAGAARAGEPDAPDAPSGPATAVTVGGQVFPCRVVRHDEKGVTVFLTEPGSTVTLQWDQLPASERERIKALVAAGDPAAAGGAGGEEIDGVEVTLRNGTVYRGVELPGRSTPETRAFRFARMPFAAIAVKDIKAAKPIRLREGELYSPQERYRRKLAVASPKTAEDYYRLGLWCLENDLAQEAGDNFEKAVLLDPGYAEKTAAKKADVEALRDRLAPVKIERPADPAARRRSVIGGWYQHVDHHILRIAGSQVSETPAVPVKVVYLTSGATMEGALKSSEDAAEVLLDVEGRTFSIERRLIARMEQKMVEKGPWRERTLAECRKYVTDAKGGIGADVVAGLSKELGLTDKEVQEIWDGRLGGTVVIGPGGTKEPEVMAAFQEVHWGVGSWLRGGDGANAGGQAAGAATVGNPRGGANRGGQNRGGQQQQGQGQQWPDPEEWWKAQSAAAKGQVLKAMCAEESGMFKVEKTFEENCIGCGSAGQREVVDAGGNRSARACEVCRGSGRFYGVSYR